MRGFANTKDAARYRWLRDNGLANEKRESRAVLPQSGKKASMAFRYWTTPEELDMTIDAMLAAEGDNTMTAWLPVPDKHSTIDPVDLLLADGSVLCGCLPQFDGDYWWDGLGRDVFIDPRYAPVTHWRLSAAKETKP